MLKCVFCYTIYCVYCLADDYFVILNKPYLAKKTATGVLLARCRIKDDIRNAASHYALLVNSSAHR